MEHRRITKQLCQVKEAREKYTAQFHLSVTLEMQNNLCRQKSTSAVVWGGQEVERGTKKYQVTKLYTLNMCSLPDVNYASTKL
jgi:hypothetical protein